MYTLYTMVYMMSIYNISVIYIIYSQYIGDGIQCMYIIVPRRKPKMGLYVYHTTYAHQVIYT